MTSDRKPGNAAKSAASRTPLKRHSGGMFSMDSEQSARMLIFGVTAAVLIAAAAFIAVGYYVAVIQPRGRTVMQVENVTVSYSDMKRRMAHEYYSSASYQNTQNVLSIPAVAYNNLLEELTLITRAESDLGVTADDAEIERALRLKVGAAENADDATFAEQFRRALSASRLHEDEYRRLVRSEVLADKVRAKLAETTPAAVPQAKVEVIAVQDVAAADAAVARINAGELWADVAKEVSLEGDAAETGGAKPFAYQGEISDAYASFAFTAAIGEISTPLQDPSGTGAFFIVRVTERADMALTDTQKISFEQQQYRDWVTATQAKMVIVDKFLNDDEARADALTPLYNDAVVKTREQLEEQERPQPPEIVPTAAVTTAAPAVGGTPPAAQPPVEAGTPAATVPANGQ